MVLPKWYPSLSPSRTLLCWCAFYRPFVRVGTYYSREHAPSWRAVFTAEITGVKSFARDHGTSTRCKRQPNGYKF